MLGFFIFWRFVNLNCIYISKTLVAIKTASPAVIDRDLFKNLDAKPGEEPIKSMDLPAMIESVAPPPQATPPHDEMVPKSSTTLSISTHHADLDLSSYKPHESGEAHKGELVQKSPVFEKSDITVTKTIETKVNIVTILEKPEQQQQQQPQPAIPVFSDTTAETEASSNKKKDKKGKNKKNKSATPPPPPPPPPQEDHALKVSEEQPASSEGNFFNCRKPFS